MIEVGLALVCALVAWSAAAALTVRLYRHPRLYISAWFGAAIAAMIALTVAVPAAMLEFSSLTHRLFHIGIALLGPLWLTWGAVEFTTRSPTVRLGVREVVAVLTIVPIVILSVDPLSGTLGSSYTAATEHFQLPAMFALGLVHTFAILVLLACVAALLTQKGRGGEAARRRLRVVLLIAGAVAIQIFVARFGLGALGQLVLLFALACMWQASIFAAKTPSATERDDDAFDEDDSDFEPEEGEMPRRRESTGRRSVSHEAAAPPPQLRVTRTKSTITIYTLHEGHGDAFDARMANAVEAVRQYEPETLLFLSNKVASAPAQRIVYAIYRDDLAYEEHEQQPHMLEFARDVAPHVAATNLIELSPTDGKADEGLMAMMATR